MANPSYTVKDCTLIFKNFSGREAKYNRLGARNFCIVIDDPEFAQMLIDEGWNASLLKKRDEQDLDRWKLKVNVNFNSNWPPQCWMYENGHKTPLNEDTIGELDFMDIVKAEVSFNGNPWDNHGELAYSAYLRSLKVKVEEDDFDSPADDEPF